MTYAVHRSVGTPQVGNQLQYTLARGQQDEAYCMHLRGGPPRPGNPAGGPPKPGPPTPAAGPCSPIPAPRPAGLEIPGPACIAVGAPAAPPGALVPSLAAGSEGGGPSTEHETMVAPRTMASPNMRFSSVSTTWPAVLAPGAPPDFALRLTLRNSSQSARTRFMCCGVLVIRIVYLLRQWAVPYQKQAFVPRAVCHRSWWPACDS